jgi:hypothetical protein
MLALQKPHAPSKRSSGFLGPKDFEGAPVFVDAEEFTLEL